MMIDAVFGKEDHNSISATMIERRLKALYVKTNPRIRLYGLADWLIVVEKKSYQYSTSKI
jgi:hypothetical protein